MANFLAELKRRHIYRIAAAYAVAAWIILQIVNNVASGLNLPNSALTLIIVLLAAGFPIALIFAWVLELKASDAAVRTKPGAMDWVLAGVAAGVIAIFAYQQLAPPRSAASGQAGVETARAAAASPAGAISIAVLPFTNLSSDKEQEFFSDGMTEEITSALAKIPDLRVVGRTSAFQFKGQNQDLRSIGRALSATHLLEGSVRKEENRLRITAQLILAENGVHVWTESYDRDLTGVFAIQEDIATAIAGALRVPLGLQPGERLVSDRTIDVESYQQYLRALAILEHGSPNEAAALLEPVVARNDNYAPAWGLLATVYRISAFLDPLMLKGSVEVARRQMQTVFGKAEMAARKAIQLDPRSAGGYNALASLQGTRGKWAEAEDLFHRALALDPNDPDTLQQYRQTLEFVGRLREALRLTEQFRALEPFVPVFNMISAGIMEANGQNQAAITILESIPSDSALNAPRNIYLARAHAAAGRFAEAADALLAIRDNPFFGRDSVEAAARLIRTAPSAAKSPAILPAFPNDLNFVYAYVGARERMLERRERDLQIGTMANIFLIWFPDFAPLRKTERFKALVRKAGLVDYWRARGWPDLCHPMGTDDFACD